MPKHSDLSAFNRVPGFFSSAELAEVLDFDGDTLVCRAGALVDGTPLFEVYRRGRPYRFDEDFAEGVRDVG
jgi:hypothetical protein